MSTSKTEQNPLIQARDGPNTTAAKENPPRKVRPSQEKSTPISISNEELKAIYERKKSQKGKQFLHLENVCDNFIFPMTLTPDDKLLIYPSYGSIIVFDIEAKQEVYRFENAYDSSICSMVMTPNSKYLVAAFTDLSLKVFNFETRELFFRNGYAHRNSLDAMTATSDSRYIICGSSDGSIRGFDLHTMKEVRLFENAHLDWISSIAVTSNDKFIISGSSDKSIKIFDLQAKQEVHHFENAHENTITSMAVTPDNKFIVSGSSDRSIKIFDIHTKQQVHHFENAHEEAVKSVVVTSDSKFVISGSVDKSIKIFDLEIKQQVHHIRNAHQGPVESVLVASDGKFIISASSKDKSIRGFDFNPRKRVQEFEKDADNWICSVVLTFDDKYVISGSSDKSIKMFDFETRKLVYHFEGAHQDWVSSLAVTPDNRFIVSGSEKSVKVFDLQTKQQVRHIEIADETGGVRVVVTPDSKFIISTSLEGRSIRVFGLKTGELVHSFQNVHEDMIRSVVVTPDSKFMISGSFDRSIKIFDLTKRELVHHFQNVHEDRVSCLAVTPDNKFLISGSYDKSVKVFDLQTKQQVYHFQNINKDSVDRVAVTPNNKFIISSGGDNSIKVFDLQTRELVLHFPNAPQKGISSLAVTSDSKYLVCASHDSYIKIFDLFDSQDDQELYFVYKRMKNFCPFNSLDYFLFEKSVESSIAQAKKCPELSVLPFRWNILHVASIYANHEFIEKMPDYSQLKMPFLLDASNKTPLHYLLAHKNVNSVTANIMFRYICDYLQDCYSKSPFEFQEIIESLYPLLSFILLRVDIKTRQKFLRVIYAKSPGPHSSPVPMFGNILSEAAVFCDSPVLTQETSGKIWNDQGTGQVEFCSSFLCLDYDILSQDMSNMVECLKEQEDQEIFRMPVIVKLIDHLWGQAELPLMIFFAIYSAFIIALSVYLTFDDRSLAYEITLLAISVVLTVNEFWQIFHLRMDYLGNIWNWIDLSHLLLTIAFLITRIADNENELARAWISTIIVIFGYIRWISLLKIFKPTRNLIQVVLTILKDMLSFITIIALIIIAFSLIFLVFNRDAGYGDYLYEAYNVLYGPQDIEDGAAWPFSQKLLMAVLAFFLNVVLLNLLISIMGDSYGQVLEMRDRTDALTRLELISEAIVYKKFFKLNHQTKRGYLVYCLPVELEGDESGQNQELESNFKAIKQIIKQNNEESKQESQMLKETLKNEVSTMKTKMAGLENEISTMKNEMLNLKEVILREFSQLKTNEIAMVGGFQRKQIDSNLALRKDLLDEGCVPEPEEI